VIVLTIGLFGLSLAVKSITHELFLEAGVSIVSVQLILMTAKNAASEEQLERHLRQIKEQLAVSNTVIQSIKETTAEQYQ
jgi:hypothetical protein